MGQWVSEVEGGLSCDTQEAFLTLCILVLLIILLYYSIIYCVMLYAPHLLVPTEPAFRLPATSVKGDGSVSGISVVTRAVSRGSKRFDTVSRNNANVQVSQYCISMG